MGGKQDKESNKFRAVAARDQGTLKKNGFKLKKHFCYRSHSPSSANCEMSSKSSKAAVSMTASSVVAEAVSKSTTTDKGQPLRYTDLFENERDSDVTFLVGVEPTIWRLPAHKFVLVGANPVFAAMLKGPMSSKDNKEEVPIEDLDPKAFENVLRFMYTNELKLTSIDLALATLFAADKYLILELIQLCLHHLEVNVISSNVISIYRQIRFLALSRQNQLSESSSANSKQLPDPSNPYIPLLNRCLEYIDKFADQVFLLEDFEALSDLSEAELSDIVFRDSLQLQSELVVFKALQVWATQQCKFKQKEITGENKRRVLGSALYSVRYILMSREDFMSGPYISDLLNKEEKMWFLRRIDGHTKCEPPHHIADRQRYLERKRGQQNVSNATKRHCIQEHDNQSTATDRNYSAKRCCRVTKIFTEVFLCFSLFFD